MKAIELKTAGESDQLVEIDLPVPTLKDHEVLVRVKAISINPVDIKVRQGLGLYQELKKNHQHLVLGWDISGIVEKTGASVTRFKAGDEVFGMVNFPGHGQAYAEFVAASADHLALKPANISHEEAAAATLAALTAWQALVTHARLQKGQKAVIQAAAGGVGHYAVQIAKYLGAEVIGTSSAANKDFVLGLGSDAHIDYQQHRIDELVQDADFVLDPIGGTNITPSLNAAKAGGTVILLPTMFREQLEQEATGRNVAAYLIIVESSGEDMEKLAHLLEKGIIRSHISASFPFSQIREAHKQIETGKTRGKIVVHIDS